MAVRRYINDMTTEVANHIDSIVESLSYFTEIGELPHAYRGVLLLTPIHLAVPMVAIAQHHDPANIQARRTLFQASCTRADE